MKTKLERGVFGRFFLIGDSGYANKNYLLTPIANPVTEKEKKYNKQHKCVRNQVERCIGIWKKRFPVIATKMRQRLRNSLKVISATAVLHNIAMDYNEEEPLETDDCVPELYQQPIRHARNAREGRANFYVRNEIVKQHVKESSSRDVF